MFVRKAEALRNTAKQVEFPVLATLFPYYAVPRAPRPVPVPECRQTRRCNTVLRLQGPEVGVDVWARYERDCVTATLWTTSKLRNIFVTSEPRTTGPRQQSPQRPGHAPTPRLAPPLGSHQRARFQGPAATFPHRRHGEARAAAAFACRHDGAAGACAAGPLHYLGLPYREEERISALSADLRQALSSMTG